MNGISPNPLGFRSPLSNSSLKFLDNRSLVIVHNIPSKASEILTSTPPSTSFRSYLYAALFHNFAFAWSMNKNYETLVKGNFCNNSDMHNRTTFTFCEKYGIAWFAFADVFYKFPLP